MKATITNRPQKFNSKHRKETPCHLHTMAVIDLAATSYVYEDGSEDVKEIATLRVYVTKSGATSACLWLCGHDRSGSGSADGCGYCKKSAAAAYAIANAGIDLSEAIGGRGMTSVRNAMVAIAKELGATRPAIVESHA